MRVITGSLIVPGSSPRTRVTASRTSLTARSMFLPKTNSTVVARGAVGTVDMMCTTSPTVATEFSTMRVTWRLEFGRRGARIGDRDGHDRDVDIGELVDAELLEADACPRTSAG